MQTPTALELAVANSIEKFRVASEACHAWNNNNTEELRKLLDQADREKTEAFELRRSLEEAQ